jgi:hypothetical protein
VIQSLTSFTVTVHYGRRDTTFDVWGTDRSMPVARVHKDTQYDSLRLYQVLAGPQAGEPAGFVSAAGAWAADRSKLGTISDKGRALGRREWQVDQHDLPTLVGRPIGASSLRYVFPLSLLLTATIADNVLPFKVAFRAPESEGFVVARSAGVRAHFPVTVRDPRIDRRLVLACVVHLSWFASADLRKQIVDLTANPFNKW